MASSGIAPGSKSPPKWPGWAAAAMIVCLALSVVDVTEALIPGWSGDGFLIGIVITAIEAIYSFRVLRLPRSRGLSMLRYRMAEACLLGILLKVMTYGLHAWGRSWADIGSDIATMLWQPSTLFSGPYVLLLGAAWITWGMLNRTLMDLEALHDPYLSHDEQFGPRESLMSRFYRGGGLLVLLIGSRHIAAAQDWVNWADLSRTSSYHLNALLYFLLGTLVLSQIRLTSLRTGWRLQQIAIPDGVGRAWTRYGLVFLALIVVVVAVLPTQYSMGLFDTALLGLRGIVDLMRRLLEFLILAITLPLSWLLSLMGHGEGGALQLPPISEALSPPPSQKTGPIFHGKWSEP